MNLSNKLFIRFCEESDSGGQVPYGQKLTAEQRMYARKLWRKFVKHRQVLGLCIQCGRKHQPSMQRCGLHRRLNREKCYTWFLANKDKIKAKVEARKAAGVCVNGLNHGAAAPGHIYCEKCRARLRQYRKNQK